MTLLFINKMRLQVKQAFARMKFFKGLKIVFTVVLINLYLHSVSSRVLLVSALVNSPSSVSTVTMIGSKY